MKKIHFISGTPRSGSTLLCNLLAQNPKFHSTASSALIDLMYGARHNYTEVGEFKAMKIEDSEKMFLSWARGGISHAFDDLTERPVVFDKGRSWIGYPDLLFKIFPDAKVIVPIRDIRGILSSMEKIRRKHPIDMNLEENPADRFVTIEDRVNGWLNSIKVGLPVNRLMELNKRFADKVLFVHAEKLTHDPISELKRIYNYIGEEWFEHDPNNVEQYTHEWDGVWGPYGDHVIRNNISPLIPDWHEILGKEISSLLDQKYNWINKL